MNEVTITVSGPVGSGKSAICGEIEIFCKALGLQVERIGGRDEKNLSGADWIHEIEMYKPTVKIVEQIERTASTSTNVAQGAEAVVTVKVYETYTGQNGWTEVAQEEYDRTKDKYEHRILRVPAPPAQIGNKRD